ncbi:DUF1761 domain-containing protein [Sphingomonas sp. S1-29]|uniref:DUF1761 domain-containing protein n=1 Tax=Sphingomonas sp. S1-29 TaxID=2991074 RepID=UPI0022406B68|nr:DUF1761 domain-containing protein [Sphingomonas sp. S1-29]UZK69264.1 DUF1761 domain-containing protein [Sphingomonas sp. S1-29]
MPILVATLAGLAIGAVWYRDQLRRGGSVGLLVAAFVAEFWLCAILAGALILAPAQADRWTMSLGSAVVIWIGFVVPALVVTLRLRGVRAGGIAGDCGHWLVVMLVQAAILQGIGLVAPAG